MCELQYETSAPCFSHIQNKHWISCAVCKQTYSEKDYNEHILQSMHKLKRIVFSKQQDQLQENFPSLRLIDNTQADDIRSSQSDINFNLTEMYLIEEEQQL